MAKHATKYNIKAYYNKFIATMEAQAKPIEEERREIYIVKVKLYAKILKRKEELKTIDSLFRFLLSIQYSPNLYSDAKNARFSQLAKLHLAPDLATDCIAIMEYTRRDKKCKQALHYIESYKISSSAYKKILDSYYGHISNWILQGYMFYIGTHLGRIYIKERHKSFVNEFGETRGIVDHAASIVLLESIAKKQEKEGLHSLYTDYKVNKYYTPQQFIHLMKPYTYSPDSPDLPKWVIYHTDDWIPYFIWSNRDYTMTELNAYTFKPTSFINTEVRNKSDFLEKVETVDDIINCDLLGAKDKMFLIKRLNDSYYKETRDDIS